MLVLSGDEVDRYNISDVVLPCVGTATAILPTNKVGVRLTEILTTLGISMASFRCVMCVCVWGGGDGHCT